MFGASTASNRYIQGGLAEAWRGNFGADLEAARADLTEEAFNTLWAQGRAMSLTEAVEFALGEERAVVVEG